MIAFLFLTNLSLSLCLSLSQYCKSLGPQLRQQATFIFATREKNPENRNRLYESFNTVFKSRAEFEAVFNSCTQNREILVLSNIFNESDNITDNAFWWKAKMRKKFRVNRKSVAWKLSEALYDKNHPLRSLVGPVARPKNRRVVNMLSLPPAAKRRRLN